MKRFRFSIAVLSCLCMILTSCTLNEPKAPVGNPEKSHLSSLSYMGINLIKFSYDGQGRLTKISLRNEQDITFTYSGSEKTPSQIVVEEFEERYWQNRDQILLDNKEVWSNITYNNDGFITSCTINETTYDYREEYERDEMGFEDYDKVLWNVYETYDVWTEHMTYDAAGHLTKTDDVTLVWQNGLLVEAIDHEDPKANVYITYCDADNVANMWDPFNEVLGTIGTSGFFGNAPAKLFEKATSPNWSTPEYYSYQLHSNGLIKQCRIWDDGEEMTLKYNYK